MLRVLVFSSPFKFIIVITSSLSYGFRKMQCERSDTGKRCLRNSRVEIVLGGRVCFIEECWRFVPIALIKKSWPKQLRGENTNFSLYFQVTVPHGKEVRASGMWCRWLHYFHRQKNNACMQALCLQDALPRKRPHLQWVGLPTLK